MQQPISVVNGPIRAKLTLPGEKSISYRAIMLAALADGVSEISGLTINNDTKALINALHQLGIVTQLDEKTCSCIIAGGSGKFPKKQATIWCGDTIMAVRFLTAACSTSPGVYYFDGAPELRKQPIANLLDLLKRKGAQFIPSDASGLPFTLIGSDSLEGGEIIFDNNAPAQLITAAAIMAPYARTPITLTMLNNMNSYSVELTCSLMADFGVLVHHIHKRQLMIPVPQRYQSKDYMVEPDLALATYFFAAAAATAGEITIQAINRAEAMQPDINFLKVLEKMGCQIQDKHTGLTVRGTTHLEGIEVSMAAFSDSFLALAALAPFANSPTRISHIGQHIKPKERERMQIMHDELQKMGLQVERGETWLKIFPGIPQGGIVRIPRDYRLGLAFSIIGLRRPGIIIEHAEKVTAVYPDFFSTWGKLAEKNHVNI